MTADQFVFWLMGYINSLNRNDIKKQSTGLTVHQWNEILKALRQVKTIKDN